MLSNEEYVSKKVPKVDPNEVGGGGGLYCACPKAQKHRNFQHYTCRHAGLNEHKVMTWAPALKKYENYKTKVSNLAKKKELIKLRLICLEPKFLYIRKSGWFLYLLIFYMTK